MRESKAVNVLASLVILGAGGAGLLAWRGGLPPRLNPKPHAAVGQALARQALALLKPGGQITVITRDTTWFKNPASDVQLASFQRAIRKAGAVIGAIHALQADPISPVGVPSGDFFDFIRNTAPGNVIVSFMGPPLLSEAQRGQLGQSLPDIVAFCSGSLPERVDLRALFDQGLLRAAVVSRRPRSALKPTTLQEWFDRSYVAVTAANLNDLPAPTSAPGEGRTP
jgi:hypothetical protein